MFIFQLFTMNEIKDNVKNEGQKEQKKGLKKTLCVYFPNGDYEEYKYEEYQWEYMSDEIRGEIRKYQDMPIDITLYQYNILNIVKRDKSKTIRISGNYAVEEIYEK